MDKITLSNEQIESLKYFIRSKGFVEPVLINEILDHFACKVEEELENNDPLSLSDAMSKAHKSFGVNGFRPIAKALDDFTRKRYRKFYYQILKETLFSLKWLPLIFLAGIGGYQLFIWANTLELSYSFEGVFTKMIIFIFSLIAHLIVYFATGGWKKREGNYFIQRFYAPLLFILSIVTVPGQTEKVSQIWIFALWSGIAMAFILAHSVAQYYTISKAIQDHDEILSLEK